MEKGKSCCFRGLGLCPGRGWAAPVFPPAFLWGGGRLGIGVAAFAAVPAAGVLERGFPGFGAWFPFGNYATILCVLYGIPGLSYDVGTGGVFQ